VRKVVFDNLPFLLSDTVGFIRKLPQNLHAPDKLFIRRRRKVDAEVLARLIFVGQERIARHDADLP